MMIVEALIASYVAGMSEKKAAAYLADVDRRLSANAVLAQAIPIRQTPRAAALARNRIAAAEAWQASAPVFIASMRRG